MDGWSRLATTWSQEQATLGRVAQQWHKTRSCIELVSEHWPFGSQDRSHQTTQLPAQIERERRNTTPAHTLLRFTWRRCGRRSLWVSAPSPFSPRSSLVSMTWIVSTNKHVKNLALSESMISKGMNCAALWHNNILHDSCTIDVFEVIVHFRQKMLAKWWNDDLGWYNVECIGCDLENPIRDFTLK